MQLVIDHLWQSTLFVLAAGLVTLGLRANAARVRYGVWFAASMKFIIPFAALGWLGKNLGMYFAPPAAPLPMAFVMDLVAAPAPPHADTRIVSALAGIWLTGSAVILGAWLRRYYAMVRMAHRSTPAEIEASVPVKLTAGEVEPGLIGVLRPVLLLPEHLFTHLTSAEFRAVLAHEVSHFHRRDNLTAAAHMLVQAVFWFHPLVWWIGAKLVAERERACDEAVLASGNDPATYAEAILKVCKFYVKSPLICVPGVSGADLRSRVEQIMRNAAIVGLSRTKRCALGAVAVGVVAAPLVVGWAQAATRVPSITPLSGLTPDEIAAATQISYDVFLGAVDRGEIDIVSVVQANVTGRFTTGEVFRTTAPWNLWGATQALESLRRNGVSIIVPPRADPSRPNIGAAEVYPAESIAAREEGAVVLRLTVDETGDVIDADVDRSSGFQRLDVAARNVAVDDWRFLAGRMDGAPQAMEMRIRMNFKLDLLGTAGGKWSFGPK